MMTSTIQSKETCTGKVKKILLFLLAVIFWFSVWFVLYLAVDMEFLLPSPIKVISRTFSLFNENTFWISVMFSLLRIMLGFLLGIIVGILFAVLMQTGETIRYLLSFLLTVIKCTPIASFILLIWVFSPQDILPSIIGALVVIPIVAQNVYTGINNTDTKMLEVCKTFQFGFKKTVLHCYIPSVYPHFSSAAITSLGMAWKAGVTAEVLAYVRNSLGKQMYLAKSSLNIPDLFSYTIVIIILSMIIEKLIKFVFGRMDRYIGR